MGESPTDRRAAFPEALRAAQLGEPFSSAEEDALSALDARRLAVLREVWDGLAPAARAELIHRLHDAAERRLELEYSPINHVALDDPDADVRLAAVEAALEDRSPRLRQRLLEILRQDASPALRQAAAEALSSFALLGELGDLDPTSTAEVRSALFASVRDGAEAPEVRSSALASLGYFSDVATMEELGAAFGNPQLRLGAVRGMGRSADPRWTDRLMPVLGSEDPRMREEAARGLGEIEDERAVAPLTEALDDPVRAVRLAAVEALGSIGGDEAREALLYVAEDPDPAVQEAVEKALSTLEFFENPLDL